MRGASGWLSKALILLGCISYPLLAHVAVSEDQPGLLRVALLSLPVLVLGCWIIAYSRNKLIWLMVLVAAGTGIFVLERQAQLYATAVYGVPHAGAYSFLLWFFGRTLRRGKEPLITRLARRVHGALPPYMEAYTRAITVAWCVFFAVQLVVSALLFEFASPHAWSLFINILNFPLLAAMFAAEYLYRVTRYRNYPHASIAQMMHVFVKDSSFSNSAKAR
jgi:uncharacterized membrane protein